MTGRTAPLPPFSPVGGFFLLALLLLAGCSGMMNIPQAVEPAQAWNMIRTNSRNPDLVIIDVRTREEYLRGHIPLAINMNIQSSSFRRDINDLPRDKTYFLYCRAGNRSFSAMEIMTASGFEKVAIISGGFNAWTRAGLRITSATEE